MVGACIARPFFFFFFFLRLGLCLMRTTDGRPYGVKYNGGSKPPPYGILRSFL